MKVIQVLFEEPLILSINGEIIQIVLFKTQEEGNIKLGIDAPRSLAIYREEIYHTIKEQDLISDD